MENRKKYAVFTMDVEEFNDTECVANSGQKVTQDMLDGLDEYIRLLEKYEIKATMFTVCQTAQKVKERLLRYLHRGHRIALHGLKHTPPCTMDDECFRRETLEAKTLLEEEFQTRVTGYRAPCFSLDEGKLDILISGDRVSAGPGEAIFIPKGSTIEFSAPERARFLYVTYPADWQSQG